MDSQNHFFDTPIDVNASDNNNNNGHNSNNNNNNNDPLGFSPLPQDLMLDPPLDMSTYTSQPSQTMNPSSLWNSPIGGSGLGSQPIGASSMINLGLGATTTMGIQPMANPISIYTGLPHPSSQQLQLNNQPTQGQNAYSIQHQSRAPMLVNADLHYHTPPPTRGTNTPQSLQTNSYASLTSQSPDASLGGFVKPGEPSIKKEERDQVQRGPKRKPLELDGDVRSRYLERNRVAASKCRKKKKHEVQILVSKATELETKRDKLAEDLRKLKKEKGALKNCLMDHAGCGHTMIDAWITSNASDFVNGTSSTSSNAPGGRRSLDSTSGASSSQTSQLVPPNTSPRVSLESVSPPLMQAKRILFRGGP